MIAVIGIIITMSGVVYNCPADVQSNEVVLFGFIRGYESFNRSDCLILGIIWDNPGGSSRVIENPTLKLEKLGKNSEIINEKYFVMKGDFQDINDESINNGYDRKHAFIFEPHSKSIKYILFRPENYWDKAHEDYYFNFSGEEKYRVSIFYWQESEKKPIKFLFTMPIFKTVNNLNEFKTGNYSYDFFQIEDSMVKS